jgi:hypothetical protein
MKYRITPANLFCLFVIGMVLYCKISKVDAKNVLGISYVFFFSIFVFILDIFLQYFISSYKKIIILEIILMPLAIWIINLL